MTPFSRDGTLTGVLLVAIGYSMASISLNDWDRIIQTIFIPLYTCGVIGYIVVRIYSNVIEPRLAPSSSRQHIQPSAEPLLSKEELAALQADQPIDLTGVFKLLENHNFEDFLAAQGVPWALRGAANRARPTHRITHKGNLLTIKIEGIIESQTTYQIGGPPVRGLIRGRTFEDTVVYLDDGRGVHTNKRAVDDGYTVTVCRRLRDDGSQIIMESSVTFDDESKATVECKQIFQSSE